MSVEILSAPRRQAISRSQIWQWVNNATTMDSGAIVTAELVRAMLAVPAYELID